MRPNDMTSVTTHMATRARPATEVRQRAMHTPMPTKTSTVTIGKEDVEPGREAVVVVEVAGDQPPQHLPGAVAVLERRALQNLVPGRPVRLRQHGDDDPGRRQRSRGAERHGAPESPPQVRRDQEGPHDQRHEGQVARLVVQGDRQHDEEDGEERRHATSPRQRPVGEPPRQRERPRRPQLRPHAVTDPDVGLGLVADAGGRGEERRHRGRRRRRPAAQAEEPSTPVDGDRPQGQQQVEGPAEHRVGVGERPDDARQHGRQALVVQELR